MPTFISGQRWISQAELQMGLGTVLATDHRTVTVLFLATGDTRVYAKQTAPLSRVLFSAGEQILAHEGWSLQVASVEEKDGLLTYHGSKEDGSQASLEEGQLDNHIQLNRPIERLLNGQIDQNKLFELRYQTLQHANRLGHSDLHGLSGVRTSLIPHQLYIAHEVANRYAPRVLLADEVGLGKTIEAGLILHQQLLTERARRVLIVVPETLLHQWLVEMLRRFNLTFSLFDEERCQALCQTTEESTEQENPFHSEQLVLCSQGFLTQHPQRCQQALDGNWDLLVVDEAHHLQWSAEQPSIEYTIIEQLSRVTKGVLLLTATPEQLGKASHFARLRLLDADRFADFDTFLQEEQSYEPVAQAIENLLSGQTVDEETYSTLADTIEEGDNRELLDCVNDATASDDNKNSARTKLIEHLLDRHGTGRVLFRNTRNSVKGFPERTVHPYPLALPETYAPCLAEFQSTGISEPQLLLCPELIYQASETAGQEPWTKIDPRVEWLTTTLKKLNPEKVLVITASADSAIDLATYLHTRTGIHAAMFHEGLSIVERDRAAAFFADQENGSQVLICSEIGSEGRNFQFAHHMVMFDLPYNPDLLEQRIGRLDRIGQTQTIKIHVPYLENSAQEVMFNWYHQGLNAFEHTCPAGHTVFVQVEEVLMEALHQIDEGIADLPNLIATTQSLHQEMNEALQKGRDRLLEYNACRPHIANDLRQRAEQQDSDTDLPDYLDQVFDGYGIDTELHSQQSLIVRPSDHMQGSFPGLSPEGMTITYDRHTALANEDIRFLTWEHPLVSGAMEMILSNETGNTALTSVKFKGLKAGSMLIECLYVLEAANNAQLQSSRYLPATSLRVVMDQKGRDLTTALGHKAINQNCQVVPKDTAKKVASSYAKEIREMLTRSEALAKKQAPEFLTAAHEQTKETLLTEINRLKALRTVNPNVRDEEIEFFNKQLQAVTEVLEASHIRLDSMRIIVAM